MISHNLYIVIPAESGNNINHIINNAQDAYI